AAHRRPLPSGAGDRLPRRGRAGPARRRRLADARSAHDLDSRGRRRPRGRRGAGDGLTRGRPHQAPAARVASPAIAASTAAMVEGDAVLTAGGGAASGHDAEVVVASTGADAAVRPTESEPRATRRYVVAELRPVTVTECEVVSAGESVNCE